VLSPAQQFQLRQQVMQCALGTATQGEPASAVLARADAYLLWLTEPVGDQAAAVFEREEHVREGGLVS
jgi:hypothetical protein